MLKEIRHVGIVVKNMKKALHFYKDFLKLQVIKSKLEEGEYIETLLGKKGIKLNTVKLGIIKDSKPLIELYHFENEEQPNYEGFQHISFTVENIKVLRVFLLGKGIKPISLPQEDKDKKHLVMFSRDPDGNLLEFVEVL